jgi:serine/threonine protein kinase
MIEHLGKYRIDSILGKGAMGVVYKAFDPHIERIVAPKTIRKELFSNSQQQELISRFKNEAQAAGRLNHPNIVAVYDYGEDSESAYIAMEFVEGTPLSTLMVAGRPIALNRVTAWMGDLLLALDYAHLRGVVHRDVKPANLLITNAAQVKVSDFGIARIESSTLTQTGSMIGTPSYMSPERFRGDVADGRSDRPTTS